MLQERLCEVVEHVMFYQVFAFLIGVCFRDESCSLGRLTSLAPVSIQICWRKVKNWARQRAAHKDLCFPKILATKDFDSKRVQCSVPSCDLQDEHHHTKVKYFACFFFFFLGGGRFQRGCYSSYVLLKILIENNTAVQGIICMYISANVWHSASVKETILVSK